MEEDKQITGPYGAENLEPALERYRQLARQTQNPVYAWLALEHLLRTKNGFSPDWPKDRDLSVPGWIADYLLQAVMNVTCLAGGVDFRKLDAEPPAAPFVTSLEEAQGDVIQSAGFQEYVANCKISPSDALLALSAALGFTRGGGWNAFGSFVATTAKMQEYHRYQSMRQVGIPAKQAVHAIGSAIGVTDASRVYARIRESRSLVEREDVVKPQG